MGEIMGEICTDNRFEVIKWYKQKLIEDTNIEQSPKEMEVIENILFRFWQMGWLDDKVVERKYIPGDIDHNVSVALQTMRDIYWKHDSVTIGDSSRFVEAQEIVLSALLFKKFDIVRKEDHGSYKIIGGVGK